MLAYLKLVVNATTFLKATDTFKDSVQRNGLTLSLGANVIAVANIDRSGGLFFSSDDYNQKHI